MTLSHMTRFLEVSKGAVRNEDDFYVVAEVGPLIFLLQRDMMS